MQWRPRPVTVEPKQGPRSVYCATMICQPRRAVYVKCSMECVYCGNSHARVDLRQSLRTNGRKAGHPKQELATVAQPCGYPIDGQMDCLHHALVGITGPVTLQQFDLYMVERIEVGKAVLNRARQQRILLEQCLLAGDCEQHFNRGMPFRTQPRKDGFAQFRVLDELRVA